ncbi:MAG: acetylxylan esterase [Gemmataceae bacterium]|nr:acetylxylan esterase [Gemmataceae bacterium]
MLLLLLLPCAGLDLLDGKKPADKRLSVVRTLNDKDFFLKPPATLDDWKRRAASVRERLLVSQGLWPMWDRPAIKATVHGKVERDGYSIEKVFFASVPGHYVTGSLYRPLGKDKKPLAGKRPGVLAAHGHWADGRMHDPGEAAARASIKDKAEQHEGNARYFLQAIPAQLARMGCVVFFYDMVGYADSKALKHEAFAGAEAELRLQNLMGLQTFNSLRALDFLAGLPDVDDDRIGMTGASGGGTQTFILGAIDQRVKAAVPAVMVSTRMQGGCVCENASHLRVGTGNVEFAALFAPRPMALTGANDWTLEIEKKGFPEMRAVWKLFGKEDDVAAKCWPEFGHNYNLPAREYMYAWFNRHLKLGADDVREREIEPESPVSLTVFTREHPRPADSLPVARLLEKMTEASDKAVGKLAADERRAALRVMLRTHLPTGKEVDSKAAKRPGIEGAKGFLIGRRGSGEQVPAVMLRGKKSDGRVIVWIHPEGKSALLEDKGVKAALDAGAAVLGVDVFGTGELGATKAQAVNPRLAGYTFGYNRTLLGQRCHDILTAVEFARRQPGTKAVHLAGAGKAGPWVLLARALAGDAVGRTAADLDGFRFEAVKETTDEMMLPGALKYGGLGALAGLAAPHPLLVHNHAGTSSGKAMKAAYGASPKALERHERKMDPEAVARWLLASKEG